CGSRTRRSSFRGRNRNVPKSDVASLAALEIDRPGEHFVTIQSPASDAGNFLLVDDGLAVLHNGDHPSNQSDVVALPFSGLSRLFRRGGQKTIDASGAHGWPF